MRPRRLLSLVLLLAAASLAWPEAALDRTIETAPHAPRTVAPGAPAPRTALQAAWQSVLTRSPLLRAATVSAYAYDLTRHEALAAVNPDQRQIPASVMKMFTTAAALQDLGPDFRYLTRVEAAPGVLAGQPGPIYLVGGGDPWLEARGNQGLQQLAAQVAAKVHVAARVVGVGDLFPGPRAGAAWSAAELSTDYGTGAAALEAELSSVEVLVQAGRTSGSPVTATLHFLGGISDPGYFTLQVSARTVTHQSPPPDVTRLLGSETIVVSGTMRAGTSLAVNISPADPARFAAALFQLALAQRGVRFQDPAASGSLPRGQGVIASRASPPLRLLLPLQDRFSINQMADNLLRTIALKVEGDGSAASAQAAMAAFLAQAGLGGLPPQYDGSGLSPLDSESAQGIVSLLAYAASRPWSTYFMHAMMEAGSADPQACGILCGHFVGTRAQDRVWLKTGNLDNQWNYAGYATAANGDLVAFAILEEGPGAAAMASSYPHMSAIDRMVVDLATWPVEPSAALAPAGGAPAPPAFVQSLLARLPAEGGAVRGVSVLNLRTGHLVYASHLAQLVRTSWLPRLSLLAAALRRGVRSFPDVTLTAGGPLQGGELIGPLVLDGAHDPLLGPQDLATLAVQVRAAGITRVQGPLLYVQGGPRRGDPARWPGGATWEELDQSYLPPTSRLVFGGDLLQIRVDAGPGGVVATLAPGGDGASLDASKVAVGAGPGLAATWSPDLQAFVLTGSIGPGQSEVLQVSAPNPGLLAATALKGALAQAGVTVGAGILPVGGSAGRRVASLGGPSIAVVAPQLLSAPSTLAAAELKGLLGAAATQAMRGVLGGQDSVVDPTGTSFDNYMTPQSALALLRLIWQDPREAPLRGALGTQGTWLAEGPGTAVLVGFVRGADGTPYAVAALESGLSWGGGFSETIVPPAP